MKLFQCTRCMNPVHFDNTDCLVCGATLCFVPAERSMASFERSSAAGVWRRIGAGGVAEGAFDWQPCINRTEVSGCNWATKSDEETGLCVSCQLTHEAASVRALDHPQLWLAAEAAKRQLLYSLLAIGLPFRPKHGDDDMHGLAFVWQYPLAHQHVTTGHANGTITLNLEEADDAMRERSRVAFAEPMRTLVGHLRHELAHHLHLRFVARDPVFADAFDDLFGDDRADYTQALNLYYAGGPPADWRDHFITAYASAHPWEDWAETCGHYLMLVDAMESARAWGVRLDVQPAVGSRSAGGDIGMQIVDQWLPLSRFLNAIARSIGVRDSYPFAMGAVVLDKMRFVERVLQDHAARFNTAPSGAGAAQRSPVGHGGIDHMEATRR